MLAKSSNTKKKLKNNNIEYGDQTEATIASNIKEKSTEEELHQKIKKLRFFNVPEAKFSSKTKTVSKQLGHGKISVPLVDTNIYKKTKKTKKKCVLNIK